MFNLSPIATTKMTMTMNDAAMQNMLLVIDNILPHKTSLKVRGKIFNKGAKKIIFSTHGAPNLVRFLYIC